MRRMIIAVALCLALLLCAAPALAEGALEAAANEVAGAATLDEQLALLYGISCDYAAELEAGGWDLGLTCNLTEQLPEDLLPPSEDMAEEELSVEDFAGMKFIALYEDLYTTRLLGDFQVRLPEELRAASLDEADAVLYLVHSTEARTDYIGSAYNRDYYVYVYRRGADTRTTIWYDYTTPPVSGYGTLYGETVPLVDLWNGARQWFYGTIELSYPEGTATYRIIGQSCCLAGLEGEFIRYEIPAEVEGYPVIGIEDCYCETLEELVLPEGIAWIQFVGGESLRRMNFPSTLRRIGDNINPVLEETLLNEGLEEIGNFSVIHGYGETFALPSTLKSMGRGVLKEADCAAIVVPEGVTELKDYFLMHTSRVLCVFVPESVTSFGSDLFDYGGIRIYTPEGSATARLANDKGYEWVPCARAEDMPVPVYAVQDGFEYAVVEGEAILTGYSGDETCVRVPDTLGGCPVAIVREYTFYNNDALRAVLFPDTVRRMEIDSVYRCENLEATFIPATVTDFHFQAVPYYGENGVAYTPKGGIPWEEMEWAEESLEDWVPGAEAAWFPEQ